MCRLACAPHARVLESQRAEGRGSFLNTLREDFLKMELSVVSPVYRAAKILPTLVERIDAALGPLTSSYEIILVDDGSPGRDWEVIQEICAVRAHVRGVKLTRNYGQQAALRAGLAFARGERVAVMDCDLQHNPKYLPDLFAKAGEGFDVVLAENDARRHGALKNLQARLFHRLFNFLSNSDLADPSLSSYSVLSRRAVDGLLELREHNTPYHIVLAWLEMPSARVPVRHDTRHEGKSSYTFSRLLGHATYGIVASSDKLLRVSITVGLLFLVLSMSGTLALVVSFVLRGARPGWTSLAVLISLSTGLILMSCGVLGVYLGKLVELARQRPGYVVEEVRN